jgi:AcrR family transcriptional regulator
MIRKPRTKKKVTRRDTIVDAGIRLFARVPFADITIASVAREADCGHSLVYHYFSNINNLYDAAIQHVSELYIGLISHLKKVKTTPDIIMIGVISLLIDGLNTNPMYAYYLNLFSFEHTMSPLNDTVVKVQNEWVSFFTKIIRGAQKAGRLIATLTAEEILNALQAIFQGLVSAQIFSVKTHSKSTLKAAHIYLPLLKGVH